MRRSVLVAVGGVALLLAACGKDPGRRAIPVRKGQPVPKARKASRVRRGHKASQVLKDHRDRRDRRARPVQRANQERRRYVQYRSMAPSVVRRAKRSCQYSVPRAGPLKAQNAARARPSVSA
jgi:hypothetical protein